LLAVRVTKVSRAAVMTALLIARRPLRVENDLEGKIAHRP